MKLKCYLLDKLVKAKEKEVIPEAGEKYNAYYCNICGVAECHEGKKFVELGGTIAFGTSLCVKKNYERVKRLIEEQ